MDEGDWGSTLVQIKTESFPRWLVGGRFSDLLRQWGERGSYLLWIISEVATFPHPLYLEWSCLSQRLWFILLARGLPGNMTAPQLSSSCWQFKCCLPFMTQFLAISFEQVPKKWCFSDKSPSSSMMYLSRLEYRKGWFKQKTPEDPWFKVIKVICFNFSRFPFHNESIYLQSYYWAHWGTEKCSQHIHTGIDMPA